MGLQVPKEDSFNITDIIDPVLNDRQLKGCLESVVRVAFLVVWKAYRQRSGHPDSFFLSSVSILVESHVRAK